MFYKAKYNRRTSYEIDSESFSPLQILSFFFLISHFVTYSVWLAAPFAFQFRFVIFSSNTLKSADSGECRLPLESLVQSFIVFFSFSFFKMGLEKKDGKKKILILIYMWSIFGFWNILISIDIMSEGDNQPWIFFPVTISSNNCQIRLDKHARQIKVMRIVWKLINTMLHAEKEIINIVILEGWNWWFPH